MTCSPSLGCGRTSDTSRPASSARRNAPANPRTSKAASRRPATTPGQPVPGRPARIARRSAVTSASRRAGGRPRERRIPASSSPTCGCAPGAHPHVGELLAGIRRSRGRPPARRDALVTADLRAILAGLPGTGWPGVVAGRRDAALLVLGFAGAFRRAELAGLDVSDVRPHPSDGLHVMVRAAKNDPGRAGQVKAVPYGTEVATCGPCAWARWRGVVAAADAGGRVAVLRTVRADDP